MSTLESVLKRMLDSNLFHDHHWIKHWAGHFNVAYDTILGEHNTTNHISKDLGIDLTYALYIYRKEYTFAYFEKDVFQQFGKKLATDIIRNPSLVQEWSKNLTTVSDEILAFIKSNLTIGIKKETYDKYVVLFRSYSTWHRAVKVVVDFLPPELLEKYLPIFSPARIHAE